MTAVKRQSKNLTMAFFSLVILAFFCNGARADQTGYTLVTDTSRLGTQTVYWTGILNVFSDNATYATWSTTNDTSAWKNFNFAGITGTIDSIRVKINANEPDVATANIGMFLSWDGGTNWTAEQVVGVVGSTDADYFSAANSAWGRTWSEAEFSNANFRVKFKGNTSPAVTTANVDAIWVNVWFTPVSTGNIRRQRILRSESFVPIQEGEKKDEEFVRLAPVFVFRRPGVFVE